MLCAARHSRAAYGYAMAEGHLSSIMNFTLLQTVNLHLPAGSWDLHAEACMHSPALAGQHSPPVIASQSPDVRPAASQQGCCRCTR